MKGNFRKRHNNGIILEIVRFLSTRITIKNIVFIQEKDKMIEEEFSSSVNTLCLTGRGKEEVYTDKDFLETSIFIADRVEIESESVKNMLKELAKNSSKIPVILIAEDNKLEYDKFCDTLKSLGFIDGLYGKSPERLYSSTKDNSLYIGGYLSSFKKDEKKTLKICALIASYNEEDILENTCKYLLEQKIDVHVIDNWSTDSTNSILEKLDHEYEGFTYEYYPLKGDGQYHLFELLTRKIEYTTFLKYDWYIHTDVDEIRVGCFSNSLYDDICFVDSLGFNALDFTVLDFRPVNNNFKKGDNLKESFKYFELGRRFGHFLQIKGWKYINGKRYDLASSGGHNIEFDGKKVFPYKFLLKHYPLRSLEHMRRKIFKERLPRMEEGKKKYGWHTHYDKYKDTDNIKLWRKEDLIEWNEEFDSVYLLERLFGINIKREK